MLAKWHSGVANRALVSSHNAPRADAFASSENVHANDVANRVVLPLDDQRRRIHHLGVAIISHPARLKRDCVSGFEVRASNSDATSIATLTFSSHQGGRNAHICPARSCLITD